MSLQRLYDWAKDGGLKPLPEIDYHKVCLTRSLLNEKFKDHLISIGKPKGYTYEEVEQLLFEEGLLHEKSYRHNQEFFRSSVEKIFRDEQNVQGSKGVQRTVSPKV